ncbi:MAG: nucleotidyltransferase substrate binding protein [Planctomycetaceae bacterium]|jgi:hypothetical protein|nr:nucleotidyltransferase substrate binding protein [Planctomycetaceae bacterium]
MQIRNSDKLTKAIKSLEEAINYSRTLNYQELDNSLKNIIQAAVVQNFQLTFNICQKMLQYKISDLAGIDLDAQQLDLQTTKSLIEEAAKYKLINNKDNWNEYAECQYLTTSSNSNIRTFEKATNFLEDAKELLKTCIKRIHNERRAA